MSEKLDYQQVSACIFKDKDKYELINSDDKDSVYFVINKKFYAAHPKEANFFNNKFIDRASVIDMWFEFCKKRYIYIPKWWYDHSIYPKKKTLESKSFSKKEIELFKQFNEDWTNEEIEYVMNKYPDEFSLELKTIKKFE